MSDFFVAGVVQSLVFFFVRGIRLSLCLGFFLCLPVTALYVVTPYVSTETFYS